MSARSAQAPRRVVIKIGSALLTDNGSGLRYDRIEEWARQLGALLKDGLELALVSSGAVAAGVTRLGLEARPSQVAVLQAAAAVGQIELAGAWDRALAAVGCLGAQVLISAEDLRDAERRENARLTLEELLRSKVMPIINENDTVATEEIRLGDNDALSGSVAKLLNADRLLILTDQRGIHRSDPRQDPDAPLIAEARLDDPELHAAAGGGAGEWGRGGMRTKLEAAALAAAVGADTLIAHGLESNVLERALAQGAAPGTLIRAGD